MGKLPARARCFPLVVPATCAAGLKWPAMTNEGSLRRHYPDSTAVLAVPLSLPLLLPLPLLSERCCHRHQEQDQADGQAQ